MTFPTNNLPTQSKFWAREVEKKVTNLESSFSSAEINNTTRDSQLSVTANQALIAAQQAQAAATDANNAINGLVSLSADGSTYEIHGGNLKFGTVTADTVVSSYVYAGQIDADQINAGTVTGLNISGGTLSTTGTRRVVISGTNANFYDDDGTLSGRVTAGESGRSATIYIGSGTTGVFMSNSNGMELQSSGGPVNVVGGLGLTSAGPVSGTSFSGSSLNFSSSTLSQATDGSNRIRSSTVFLSAGPLGVTGDFSYIAPIGTGTTFPLYWNSSSNLVYRLSSSERYKTDIKDCNFDYDTLLQAKVRAFKNKQDVEEHGLEDAEVTYGYIAEELHELGLTEFVVYEPDENGNMRPESVNYMSMALASHEMIKMQDQKLKALEARIQALETN